MSFDTESPRSPRRSLHADIMVEQEARAVADRQQAGTQHRAAQLLTKLGPVVILVHLVMPAPKRDIPKTNINVSTVAEAKRPCNLYQRSVIPEHTRVLDGAMHGASSCQNQNT